MYYIADNNSFMKMVHLSKVKGSKKELIENKFWLSILADTKKMIRLDKNFDRIPYCLRNEAIEEISQEVLYAVCKEKDSFIRNLNSQNSGGARANWLKAIVHNKLCDYLNHNQQIFFTTLSVEQDTYREIPLTEVIEDSNTPIISESDVYFFARFYVFFTDFNFRIKSKLMYFNKELMIERDKLGKNGGISGKHNCLTELNGKTLFELGNKVVEDLIDFVAFDIPEKYIIEITKAINYDLSEIKKGRYVGDEVFDMKYSHAAPESSRINNSFSIYENEIKVLCNEFYEEFETTETLMRR